MINTRTGNFPIGFRRLRSPWQQDAAGLIAWARGLKIDIVDLGRDADTSARAFLDAGMSIGSADLPVWENMFSPDSASRRDAVQQNAAYIRTCTGLIPGATAIRNFFLCIVPDKPDLARQDNFAYMVDSLNALTPVLNETGARLVIEGWPGPGALCCTPETVRAMLKAVFAESIGLNYDPSHLIRMHIDPLRFLAEFAHRIYHVHAKDAEILGENLYEYGWEQPPTFGKPRKWGWVTWRYCIPGHGAFRWSRALEILASLDYRGSLSVELEDENFNGSEHGEKRGITAAAHFLQTC